MYRGDWRDRVSFSLMAAGALKVVKTCAAVQPGELVLILTDARVPHQVGEALVFATTAAGATAITLTMPPLRQPGAEPPPLVAEAMKWANVIIAPTSLSVFHTEAVRSACASGARMLAISECREDTLIRGGIEADFVERAQVAETLARRLSGERLELRTRAGTHLVMEIKGRHAVANTGLATRSGTRGGLPTIEAYIAPLEGTAEGLAVVDASLAVLGLVLSPIRIRIAHGRAEAFDGGPQAAALAAILGAAGHPNAFMLSEVGIGLNPQARVVGRIIEDEGTYGTCHVALGSNVHFGGQLSAPLHLDMVMWTPDITMDGRPLVQGGRLVEEVHA
jgi:leucyl aminopeptidase (aminopeptidase T)